MIWNKKTTPTECIKEMASSTILCDFSYLWGINGIVSILTVASATSRRIEQGQKDASVWSNQLLI